MHSMRVALAARSAWAIVLAWGLTLMLVGTASAATRHFGAVTPALGVAADRLLIPSAGWRGRAIQEPHRHQVVHTSLAQLPRRWSAGAVAWGTGFHRFGGSVRVREVQRRLHTLGYRPGPVDGLFGPRTRASVAWFQVKHGLPVTGRATLGTVGHLRARTGARPRQAPATEQQITTPERAPLKPPSSAQPEGDSARLAGGEANENGSPWKSIALLALLALALAAAAVRWRHNRTAQTAPAVSDPTLPAFTQPGDPPRRVLAYVLIAAHAAETDDYREHVEAIKTECSEQGLALAGLISDVEDARLTWQRPGLTSAVHRLVTGEVDFLMVTRLQDPASPDSDLQPLLKAAEREIAIARWQLESNIDQHQPTPNA